MSGTPSDSLQEPQARADLYHFLAAAYLGPLAPEAVGFITSKGVLQELYGVLGARAAAALKALAAVSRSAPEPEELRQEYMDLFAVPAGRYVTPFEDVYRGATVERKLGPLLGDRAIAVRRLYREAGATVDSDCKELPTHIGVELAFMSFLCGREAAAQSGTGDPAGRVHPCFYRGLQLRFLREHLSAWFPQLSRAIQEQASSELYRGLAQLTEVVLERDAAWLIAEPPAGGGAPDTVH